MKQYRKKPVTIDAVQFDGLNPTEIKDFVGENCEVEIYDNEVTPPVARIVIHTLEGDMEVSKGDYVIKGVKGEFYPCKPDIFEQAYESAETQKELEEEINRWMGCEAFPEGTNITPLPQAMEIVERTAKHFFELGEKTVPSPGGYWEGFKHGVRECQNRIRDVKDTMKEQKPLSPEEKMNHPLYLEGFDVGTETKGCSLFVNKNKV